MSSKNQKIYLDVYGIKALVFSNNRFLLQYIRDYFNLFIVSEFSNPDVEVFIYYSPFYSFKPSQKISGGLPLKLAEGLELDRENNILFFSRNELNLRMNFNNPEWIIKATFKKNIFRHIANLLFFKKSKTNESYYRLISRAVIQNPILLKLQKRGLAIISAASIVYKNKAYIFVGLPGSGKSTVIKKICENLKGSFIGAENFAVVNETHFFPFPEVSYSKIDKTSYPIEAIFLIKYGNNFEIRELDKKEAFLKIKSINEYTAELPVHSFLVGLGLGTNHFDFIADDTALKIAAEENKSFEVVIDKGADLFLEYFISNYGN
jgi:hypothetical protein